MHQSIRSPLALNLVGYPGAELSSILGTTRILAPYKLTDTSQKTSPRLKTSLSLLAHNLPGCSPPPTPSHKQKQGFFSFRCHSIFVSD
jgi:hypothetical protein